MAKQWTPIKDFDNYLISEEGEVKNKRTNKPLRPILKNNRYHFNLCRKNKVYPISLDYLYAVYIKSMNSDYLIYNKYADFIYNAY